jgi:hypothetical protein
VSVDDFDDAPTKPAKKKGESHRTQGFVDEEDKCLCEAWLASSNDCINGAQQKGKVYWAKVSQQYNETRRHPPYNITSPRTLESLRKRWNYIKQETAKFCSAVEHAINNPVSGAGVMTVVNTIEPSSFNTMCIIVCTSLAAMNAGIPRLGEVQGDA